MFLALLLCLQDKVEMKGHESFYLLHVPAAYSDQASWPVVVALHGAGDREASSRELGQWAELAERRGYIALAPQSRTREWGTGRAASDGAFIRACLDDVKTRYRVDPGRVLLAGFGSGADYAFVLGVEFRAVYAAAASFGPSGADRARKGAPLYILASGDAYAGALKAAEAIHAESGSATVRKAAGTGYPAREEYVRALDWFEGRARPRGDLAQVEAYVKEMRYLDASLVLGGLLDKPEMEASVRWQLNRIEGRGLIELSKVEIAVSEKRYVDAVLRCREAAVQFSWVPAGERARARLKLLESDDRVKRALEKND